MVFSGVIFGEGICFFYSSFVERQIAAVLHYFLVFRVALHAYSLTMSFHTLCMRALKVDRLGSL